MDKIYNEEYSAKFYTAEEMNREMDKSSRDEMERQNMLEEIYQAERDGCENKFVEVEQRGSQGIGTDRDGPFAATPPVDYAWNYVGEKLSFNPGKNYYSEIEDFAKSIGFHMSQSNGIYTLRPTAPNPVSNDEEIAKFKRDNPEYRNMKGTQARGNGTNGVPTNYKGEAGKIKLNDEFREKRMINWLKDEVRWSEGTRLILKYLNKNSYRKLQKTTICKKFSWFGATNLITALTELGYLESSFNTKAKLCYQLTVKGREYVNNIKS